MNTPIPEEAVKVNEGLQMQSPRHTFGVPEVAPTIEIKKIVRDIDAGATDQGSIEL